MVEADIPKFFKVVVQVSEVNWVPRSEVTVAGTPNRATQLSMKAAVVVDAVISGSGAVSIHRVVRSIIVKRYRKPLTTGRGPTISTCTCVNRNLGIGIGVT